MRSGLARTAVEVAQVRARESERSDRLFTDAFAEPFVVAALDGDDASEPGSDSPELAAWKQVMDFNIVIRTRFFDEYLLESAAAGCTQVVLLAAGLDSRPFRLDWPKETAVFEVDLAEVIDFKDEVLGEAKPSAGVTRTAVRADLRQNWEQDLLEAGFSAGRPTVWLAEGLLIYLSADEAGSLLERVGALSAPGSRLTFEHANSGQASVATEAAAVPAMRALLALVKGGLGENTLPWLSEHGWTPQVHDRAERARAYGREMGGRSNGGLVTAVRD
jgi:methyltransferase (TIGR00027 family)